MRTAKGHWLPSDALFESFFPNLFLIRFTIVEIQALLGVVDQQALHIE
jgi:hypothetical protein